jgi:hypothetical protein
MLHAMGSKAKSLADHLAAVPDPRKIRGTLAGIPFGGLAWFSRENAQCLILQINHAFALLE